MTATLKEENGSTKTASLIPETKQILHQSILQYLHRNGFSKTLKRFQSEAQIQNDTWKDSSANLEEIYSKYIDSAAKDVCIVDEKTTTSKKKNKKTSVESEKGGEIPEDNVVSEPETKPKKKKKSKHDVASCGETEEAKSDAPKKPLDDTINGSEVNESKKKPKDKKKKSNETEVCTKVELVTRDAENGDVSVTKEDKKSSKKRKRLVSDENDDQPAKMENNQIIEESEYQKTKVDEIDESGAQKSAKKQRNGSTEPKTINAFQRVKIDQVEFAHEKLQDNSYWAKDGADVGYGAKAQEVLGQVRGRDFRHEKTKKKRGSYRGGQIDLNSHSIKFNYSDEE